MITIYQMVYIVFILVFFGSLAYYLASKLKIPRVAIILLLGLFCGVTGILNRDWFYVVDPVTSDEGAIFPLGTLVEFILIIVLFFGGYSIDIKSLKGVLRPGILLATVGAFIVAFSVALMLNFVFPTLFGGITALIIGSLIAPNDPIAVTSTQSTFALNPTAETISKFESGLDDTMVTTLIMLVCIPIAVSFENSQVIDLSVVIVEGILDFAWYTFSAILIGLIIGYFFCVFYVNIKNKQIRMLSNVILPFITFVVATIKLPNTGLPISSGFVAVFVAGLTFGRGILKNKEEYRAIYNIWSYLFQYCEIFSFMILGALVRPSSIKTVFLPAIVITLTIVLITRPLELVICTFKTDLTLKDKAYIGYIGLKGLDPAVLAIAAFDQLGGLSNPFIKGIEYIIPLTFSVILFITVIQSIILKTVIFRKKTDVLHLPYDGDPPVVPSKILSAFN